MSRSGTPVEVGIFAVLTGSVPDWVELWSVRSDAVALGMEFVSVNSGAVERKEAEDGIRN
jgi:hypothetical protein